MRNLIRIFFLYLIILFPLFSFSQKESLIDFEYETPNGEFYLVSDSEQEYILIYFYNPECIECNELKETMIKDKKINKWIETNKLKVLAILPDVDKTYWQFFSNKIPENWTNGWVEDDEIIIKTYLKKVPALYLIKRENLEIIGRDIEFKKVKRLIK